MRVEEHEIVCGDGRRVAFDEVLWTTEAGAPPWLAQTGLARDAHGFVAVEATLRSATDPLVFAAGDVARVLPHPREKAGVYAVRQGPPLAANLRRVLAGKEPLPFTPQRRHLALITTGDRYAVASCGHLAAASARLWAVKDWIDRRWMRKYQELPEMAPAGVVPHRARVVAEMRCGGCGAKLPQARSRAGASARGSGAVRGCGDRARRAR